MDAAKLWTYVRSVAAQCSQYQSCLGLVMRRQKQLGVALTVFCTIWWLLIVCFLLIAWCQLRGRSFSVLLVVAAIVMMTLGLKAPPGPVEDTQYDEDVTVDIMTYNIRGAGITDGSVDDWHLGRKQEASSMIRRYHPTIIGIQEGEAGSVRHLLHTLNEKPGVDYQSFCNRGDETTSIIWDANKVELLDSGHFYLSDIEPFHSPSRNHHHARAGHWVHFVSLEDEDLRFYVFNVHLDPMRETTRAKQMRGFDRMVSQLFEQRGEQGHPAAVVLGDFNSIREGMVWRGMCVKPDTKQNTMVVRRRWLDSYHLVDLAHISSSSAVTFHGFTGVLVSSWFQRIPVGIVSSLLSIIPDSPTAFAAESLHIDWQLLYEPEQEHQVALEPLYYKVVSEPGDNGRYPSDHYPVLVKYRLKGQ